MPNINLDELNEVSKNFRNRPKPNFGGLSSLEKAQQEVNFGKPKIENNKVKISSNSPTPPPAKKEEVKIKINISSPKIKKKIAKADEDKKKLVQSEDIDKLISGGEFSSHSISFIPYGAGLLNASQALEKINNQYKQFKTLEENYLTAENLNFILKKIEKIYDLNQSQKLTLSDFYESILQNKATADEKRKKALINLSKIKTKEFREKISAELQRMMKPQGDLYAYYANFTLIDDEFKKRFLRRILSIDAYIMKKIKELIILNQNDVLFRFDEILEFVSVINTRNILMENFHSQIEHLASHKNQADKLKKDALALEEEISQIAKIYGRLGKYGQSIDRSSSITEKLKNSYFSLISEIMELPMTKIQRLILSLETGNYTTLESVKVKLLEILPKDIENACHETYEKIEKQAIR